MWRGEGNPVWVSHTTTSAASPLGLNVYSALEKRGTTRKTESTIVVGMVSNVTN